MEETKPTEQREKQEAKDKLNGVGNKRKERKEAGNEKGKSERIRNPREELKSDKRDIEIRIRVCLTRIPSSTWRYVCQ